MGVGYLRGEARLLGSGLRVVSEKCPEGRHSHGCAIAERALIAEQALRSLVAGIRMSQLGQQGMHCRTITTSRLGAIHVSEAERKVIHINAAVFCKCRGYTKGHCGIVCPPPRDRRYWLA